ncbi:RICIN domain-containing protein [Pseudobacter ginsenosidimutans]|uniref:Ricin-type beta-trefoil lectin protein n=1 Tax=Pseudobacter ginsenosidimutans TaxID=661488 RepID=A0A4Q7MUA5_9BACT|nr:hypothetical protein [Pseudobacter ginsenosidimutans]QEC42484.1 hypothetical protein FSB84_12555 [Pseudobacter ginsenosidimutans]RZS70663.1 hypothetical protein EV199_2556 [Pseudobacter ginsenosidimutans]
MFTFFYCRSIRLGVIAGLCMITTSVIAQGNNKSPKAEKKLPAGTYYIVNVETGEAITPAMSSSGQNVFLQEFNKDGTQKWKLVSKGKKFNILLNGFNDLFFQPHPSVKDHTPIISLPTNGSDQYSIESTPSGYWVIKNQNGNFLSAFITSADKEMRFGPVPDGGKYHLWEFRPI